MTEPAPSQFSEQSVWETSWVNEDGGHLALSEDWRELPPEVGCIGGSERRMGQGLSLYRFSARFHGPVTVNYRFVEPQPFLWLAASLEGGGTFQGGKACTSDIAPGRSYAGFWRDPESTLRYAAGSHRAAGLTITRARIDEMLRDQRLDPRLDAFLGGAFDPGLCSFVSTPEVNAIVRQLFNHPYSGVTEAIFLEAKCYELIAEHLRHVMGDCRSDRHSRPRRLAGAARDIMMADLANPMSVGALAQQLGVSRPVLTEAFHAQYGASPLQCFIAWRLDRARELLQSGQYSIKEVAYLTGYSYVSNFSSAFTRKFGNPPSSARK